MVNLNLQFDFQKIDEKDIDYTYLPESLKHTSISLSEISSNTLRLDANAYNIDAKVAKDIISNNRYGVVNLWSEKNGLVQSAFHRPRFKRIYVNNKNEIPFFQPSNITDVYPKPTKYISNKTDTDIEALKIKKGMLLMTVSGTIGKVAIAGEKLHNQVFSHDLLRITGKGKYDTGYIYSYFLTKTGQSILQSNNYGAVIKHIEPDHLENIIIPNAPEKLKREIHELVTKSYNLRDESNELIDEAEKMMYQELQLEPVKDFEFKYFDSSQNVRNFSTRLSNLDLRLDSSYHTPTTQAILDTIEKSAAQIVQIRDSSVSKRIVLPGRFKRVYVDSQNGIPFFGGKQINELNPDTEKFLSKSIHGTRLGKELLLHENCILITRSGTIGKVSLVPKHWENCAANEHIIRLFPANKDIAGYTYCWLNSEYGIELIKRHTYGAVVDEIDDNHVGNIPLPLLKNFEKQTEINNLVLSANKLRYEAYLLEQQAMEEMEDIIKSTKSDLKLL